MAHSPTAPDVGLRPMDRAHVWVATLVTIVTATVLAHTAIRFTRTLVDESEIVHFTVQLFSGDPDPGWYGYGTLNMYLLFVPYWVTYVVLDLIGVVGDAEEFGRFIFRDGGLFFRIARWLYAVYGVTSVTLLLVAAWRRHVRWPWLAAFTVVVFTSPHLLLYSNYVRSDTLLGLIAVALALVAARATVTRTTLVVAGALAAAAVSVKFSGALLALVPLVLAVLGLRRGTLAVRDVAMAVLSTVALLWLFSPFWTPIDAALSIFESRIANDAFRYGAPTFGGLVPRLVRTVQQLHEALGLPLLALVPLAAAAPVRFRRLAAALAGVLALLLAPLLVSSDLPPYWFVPLAAVARGLALVGLVAIGERMEQLLIDRATAPTRVLLAGVGAVLVLGGVVVPQLRSGLVLAYGRLGDPANLTLARDALEELRADGRPILLNGPYLQHTPEVYDPSELSDAKRISRAFIFDRWQSPYLNRVFVDWLEEEYGPATDATPEAFVSLDRIRVDAPDGSPLDVRLQACDDRGGCGPLPVASVEGGTMTGPDRFTVEPAVDGPGRLVIDTDAPGDGSVELEVTVDGGGGSVDVLLDSGQGFTQEQKLVVEPGTTLMPLWLPVPEGEVLELDLGIAAGQTDDLRSLVNEPSLFVTSPAIYQRFLELDVEALPQERRDAAARLRSLYRQVVELPVVARFDTGHGPPVIIHELRPAT